MKRTYQSQITSKLAVVAPSSPARNDAMWQHCTCWVSSVYLKCNNYFQHPNHGDWWAFDRLCPSFGLFCQVWWNKARSNLPRDRSWKGLCEAVPRRLSKNWLFYVLESSSQIWMLAFRRKVVRLKNNVIQFRPKALLQFREKNSQTWWKITRFWKVQMSEIQFFQFSPQHSLPNLAKLEFFLYLCPLFDAIYDILN